MEDHSKAPATAAPEQDTSVTHTGTVNSTTQGSGTYTHSVTSSNGTSSSSLDIHYADGRTVDETSTRVNLGHGDYEVTKSITVNGVTITEVEDFTKEANGDYSISGSIVLANGQVETISGTRDSLSSDGTSSYTQSLTITNSSGGTETVDTTAQSADGTTTITNEVTGFNGHTGGSSVTFIQACFAAGSKISTARGDVAVEDLVEGDEVQGLISGVTRKVRWIGYRRTKVAGHPLPQEVRPVRVRKDAFAAGVPNSDLVLSPCHSVFVDGMLVPVGRLVNGVTIVAESADTVTYYHIELANEAGEAVHDVILAHGLTVESYLDTGNRNSFENSNGPILLIPNFSFKAWEVDGCAPLVLSGDSLAPVVARLAAQAEALGYGRTTDAALSVVVDGIEMPLTAIDSGYHVRLPQGAKEARLVSRIFTPSRMVQGATDDRWLGIAVVGLSLDGEHVSLHDARVTDGWHNVEGDWRWTTGDAGLNVAGASELTLTVADWAQYWAKIAA